MGISIGHAFEVAVSVVFLKHKTYFKPGSILFYQHKTKANGKSCPVWDSLFVDSEQAFCYYKEEFKPIFIVSKNGNTVTLKPALIDEIERYMSTICVLD